ncbi:MAG: septation protein A [Betaproteobacteria bacterium]
MKMIFDLLPVVLFFVAYKLSDIFIATGIAILASILQLGWLRMNREEITTMHWTSVAIIVFFGGLTLMLRDETFIKWKPTVLYITLALTLIVGRWVLRRNLVQKLMGNQIKLPDIVWDRINLAWIGFFVFLAVLNIWVAQSFSTDAWVNFKFYGIMSLTFAFIAALVFYMARYMQTDDEKKSDET